MLSLATGHRVPLPAVSVPLTGEGLLGLRPDDLTPDAAAPLVTGRVALREPPGGAMLIYVDTPSGEIIAPADGRTPLKVRDTLRLGAAPETLHMLDRETGLASR